MAAGEGRRRPYQHAGWGAASPGQNTGVNP